jgi:endonuclease G
LKNLIFVFLFFYSASCAPLFIPKSQGEYIKHKYYSLSYDEEHEQAEWVHYKLDSIRVILNKNSKIKTDRNYKLDTLIQTGSAHKSDISGYKYDKGHLAPAADMKMDYISVREAAYMSNISPQVASFNQGIWLRLENRIRSLAKKSELYITTGGVLKSDLEKIGRKNKVSVPKEFYKIIYDARNQKMFAYLMPNTKLDSIEKYVVTVDSIESITGIDFYPQLKTELESKLESVKNSLPPE